MKFRGVSLLFIFLSWNVLLGQFDIPEKPAVQTSVYDYVNLLSETQKSNLEQKLIRYADSTSTQIVAIIIETTKGEDINFLGAQWGQKWGIGQAG
ncbi:MAG: TPM domain-containing protein, partial [Flavobacteriaceae bacterium]|nr:TPM domain-containing protein [Flavobacteriaceae bacterium]